MALTDSLMLTNPLANPILGVVLRVGSLRGFEAPAWLGPVVRGLAAFCMWGGCFILATEIAVQIFHLHGELTAVALVTIAVGMARLLLPKAREADGNRRDD